MKRYEINYQGLSNAYNKGYIESQTSMLLIYRFINYVVLKKKNIDNLTSREKEIYQLLMIKSTYATISGTLGITLGTVKQHVHNIYIKLDVRTRKALR